MHSKQPALVLLVSLVLLGVSAPGAPLQESTHAPGFLYAEGRYLMLDGQPFIMKGFNYFPRDYGWTSMTEWDWDAVDQELALAESLQANTIRTGIGILPGTGNERRTRSIYATSEVTPESLAAIDHFLELADQHGLKVVFWLNEAMPWELYNPVRFETMRLFLESVIPRYASDPRVAAWDLATDLDGSMLLPPPAGGYGDISWMNRDTMVDFLEAMAETVKGLDPNHPVAVGFCWPSSSLLVQDSTDFLFFQFLGADYPQVLENQGATGAAEDYQAGAGGVGDTQAVAARLEAKLQSIESQLTHPMPIVLSEYGYYSGGESSEELQAGLYQAVLDAAFIRRELAGALNWALTDFIWPPKAYTIVPMDAPQSTVYERTFGIFRLDYSPKPAAYVAEAYHAASPLLSIQTSPEELRFVFSQTFVPGPEDNRELAVAFDRITFLGENNRVLLDLDIGDPSARPYLAGGFYEDEGPWESQADTFAWAGGELGVATIRVPFPDGTKRIEMHVLNGQEGIEMQILIDGEEVRTTTPLPHWGTIGVDLPANESLQPGDILTVRGKFNIPVDGGTVTAQASADGAEWSDVASAVPQAGRVVVNIPAQAGANHVRLAWSGAGLYGPATSDVLLFEVSAPPSPVPPTASPTAFRTPTPPAEADPRTDTDGWSLGVPAGLAILLAGVGALLLRRRASSRRTG